MLKLAVVCLWKRRCAAVDISVISAACIGVATVRILNDFLLHI